MQWVGFGTGDENSALMKQLRNKAAEQETLSSPLRMAARQAGLLEVANGHIRPTPRGRRFLNRLLAGFLN